MHIQVGEARRRAQGARWARRGGGRTALEGAGQRSSRGVDRASGAPSPFLSAVRPPPPLVSCSVGGSQRSPFLRSRWARPAGGRGGAGAEGRRRGGEEAEWSGWMHKKSCARVQEARNEHRGQLRSTLAFSRLGRGECGGEAGFGCWAAEAAPVAVVAPTRLPSPGSIPAPIPRSPASGDARRRGFGLDPCWRRGAAGSARGGGGGRGASPACAPDSAGATAQARRRGTPEHDCVVAGLEAITFHVCTLWRRRVAAVAAAAAAARRPLACGPLPPSAGRSSLPTRVVEAHGALLLSSSIAGSPPTPPFGLRRVRRDPRPTRPAAPSPPIRRPVPNTWGTTNTLKFIDETHVRMG